MQNDETPRRRTRRSFIKRSAAAGVGAKSALIFGGLAMTAQAAASGAECDPMTRLFNFFTDTDGNQYDACYFTGPFCDHKQYCGIGLSGQPAYTDCGLHRSTKPGQVQYCLHGTGGGPPV